MYKICPRRVNITLFTYMNVWRLLWNNTCAINNPDSQACGDRFWAERVSYRFLIAERGKNFTQSVIFDDVSKLPPEIWQACWHAMAKNWRQKLNRSCSSASATSLPSDCSNVLILLGFWHQYADIACQQILWTDLKRFAIWEVTK